MQKTRLNFVFIITCRSPAWKTRWPSAPLVSIPASFPPPFLIMFDKNRTQPAAMCGFLFILFRLEFVCVVQHIAGGCIIVGG